MRDEFLRRGWLKFPADEALTDWLTHAIPAAHTAIAVPENAHWLRCQGTWFAGVNVLPNSAAGEIGASGPLRGQTVSFLRNMGLPVDSWDRAQVSVVYPGYPKPREGESAGAFRYRRDRDAAHVDGLLPVGEARRRMLRETHAFILGLPLTRTGPGASPLVVWEGSHEIMRAALRDVLAGTPVEDWPNTDVTEAYHAARRKVFDNCARVELTAQPGEAYVVHRLALHGVAPWKDGAVAPKAGRMIAYFRPELPGPLTDWFTLP